MISYVVLILPSDVHTPILPSQQHPNEYIRGATLRFLQKISRDIELLEPLIPTVRANLEHRHSYVRRAAVFALHTIHREHPSLVPDAAELMQTFLAAESDASCRRNALVFLANVALPRAVEWLRSIWDGIIGMDEGLQMAVIEVARMDCAHETTHRVSCSLGLAGGVLDARCL